jgi:TolA-binding protein
MDCEKFESTLLDELYDELDEVTSAAAKRHVGGCARCAALLSGLKATRRLAVLPIVEPPADLEDRILAAAKEAQKVVPIGRRMSNVVSLAGSWAMRPQSAMAALFLVMIGTSALLIKGKVAKPPSSTMIVSEQGEPVASAAPDTVALAPPAAAPDNGVQKDSKTASAVAAATATAAASALAPNGYASGGDLDGLVARAPRAKVADDKPKGLLDDLEEGSRGGAGGAPPPPAAHYASGASGLGHLANNLQSGPGAPQSAPAQPAMPAPQGAQAPQALGGYGSPKKDESNSPAEKQQQTPPSDFDNAMIAYNAGDYATATQLWDNGARNGDLNAALWEARAIRESSGCGAAAARFDRVAQQAGVSVVAYDAMFDAAKCYRALGQYDAARARLNQLLLVPSYINRAQNELNAMGPKAATKARPPNAAAQQQQQQQAPASPPPAATQNSY